MNLQQTLVQTAHDFDLNADDLLRYAAEDTETGWDAGEGAWPNGSIWTVEGQILYALIRATKPKRILEIGTYYGCSTTHMLLAMRRNDNGAVLDAIDKDVRGIDPGHKIPSRLKSAFTFYKRDAVEWLANTDLNYDFIFEDALHLTELTRNLWLGGKRRLNPGGFMISHDAMHYIVGNQVLDGIALANSTPFTYLTEPSDCGLAIERSPFTEDIVAWTPDDPYNKLWDLTGPQQRDMREWMREQTGTKIKPKKFVLVELLKQWDALGRVKCPH